MGKTSPWSSMKGFLQTKVALVSPPNKIERSYFRTGAYAEICQGKGVKMTFCGTVAEKIFFGYDYS